MQTKCQLLIREMKTAVHIFVCLLMMCVYVCVCVCVCVCGAKEGSEMRWIQVGSNSCPLA